MASSLFVGVGDVFGFPMLAPRYELLNYVANGINNVSQTGFIAGVTTNPATATTGDVRGVIQLSATGGLGTAIGSPFNSNNTSRLTIFQTVPLFNNIAGTPTNPAPFFGVTQA